MRLDAIFETGSWKAKKATCPLSRKAATALKLWTWQKEGSGPTVSDVDPRQSDSNYDVFPHYRPAFERLWKELETDQLIWCFADKDEAKSRWSGRKLWCIEVPEDLALATIDSGVWERILNGVRAPIPQQEKVHDKWSCEAMEKGVRPVEYRERKREEYYKLPPPRGDWWLELYLENREVRGWSSRWLEETLGDGRFVPEVLLKRPVPESCVRTTEDDGVRL